MDIKENKIPEVLLIMVSELDTILTRIVNLAEIAKYLRTSQKEVMYYLSIALHTCYTSNDLIGFYKPVRVQRLLELFDVLQST